MPTSTHQSSKDGAGSDDLKDLSLDDLESRLGVKAVGLSGSDAAT